MDYFIGVDNGGTVTKAILVDMDGNVLSHASRKISTYHPKALFVERDMEEVWQKNAEVIKECIFKSGVYSEDIKAISFSGHGKGLYPIGFNGKIIDNSILSTDNRAHQYIKLWEEEKVNEALEDKIYQTLTPPQVPALVRWLMDYKPELIEEIQWFFGVKDYLRFRLTGMAHAEITDFSGSGIIDLNTRNYSDEIFDALGLSGVKDKFPPLVNSTESVGYVHQKASEETGLPTSCEVIAGAFDINCSAIAMGVVDESKLAVIGGTWSINEFLSKKPSRNYKTTKNSLFCIKDYILVEESSPTSASNLEWFIQNVIKEISPDIKGYTSIYDYTNALVENIGIDINSPIFLPYLYGGNDSEMPKASFIGLDSSHSIAHMIRAVYEGVAFSHKLHLERLLDVDSNFDAIRLTGGVTNSHIWTQIFADVFNMRIEVIDQQEVGAFGATILAKVGSKYFKSIEDAIDCDISINRAFNPVEKNVKLYNAKCEKFKKVVEELENLWELFH